jgi:hypothetical protein
MEAEGESVLGEFAPRTALKPFVFSRGLGDSAQILSNDHMHNSLEEQLPATGQPAPRDLELGQWLGRREAFGLIAGRCSAADIECLRRIRDEKMYRDRANNWDQFCTEQVGASRRRVDQSIRHLEEFGPAFFHAAQLTRITAEEFRAIAPHVSAEGVRLDGEVIAFVPEERRRVAAAIAELGRRSEAKTPPAAPSFAYALKRCGAAARLLESVSGKLNPLEELELTEMLWRIRNAAAALGVVMVEG